MLRRFRVLLTLDTVARSTILAAVNASRTTVSNRPKPILPLATINDYICAESSQLHDVTVRVCWEDSNELSF
jgi:hypothetical protein